MRRRDDLPRTPDNVRTSPTGVRDLAPPATRTGYTGTPEYGGRSRADHDRHDSRYHRPDYRHVRHHHHVYYGPPSYYYYRPYYTRWWCHPYYRYQYYTGTVVWFGWTPYAWYDWWAPPARYGWVWVGGYWYHGYWVPGYWQPMYAAPRHYVYVPGYWYRDAYVEGYYRRDTRSGWEWMDGYYLDDGMYVPGHWRPRGKAPDGYMWEPGLFDGETYVDGFWRPEYRSGYRWVSSYFDQDGVHHSGYWYPLEEQPSSVWIPGWFDGEEWIAGYWVSESQYASADVADWEPAEGLEDGWSEKPARKATITEDTPVDDLPLALPVEIEGVETVADGTTEAFDVTVSAVDASHYPTLSAEVRVEWAEGEIAGAGDWDVTLLEGGAVVKDAKLAWQRDGNGDDILRLSWTSELQVADRRELRVIVATNGESNGAEGDVFEVLGDEPKPDKATMER